MCRQTPPRLSSTSSRLLGRPNWLVSLNLTTSSCLPVRQATGRGSDPPSSLLQPGLSNSSKSSSLSPPCDPAPELLLPGQLVLPAGDILHRPPPGPNRNSSVNSWMPSMQIFFRVLVTRVSSTVSPPGISPEYLLMIIGLYIFIQKVMT